MKERQQGHLLLVCAICMMMLPVQWTQIDFPSTQLFALVSLANSRVSPCSRLSCENWRKGETTRIPNSYVSSRLKYVQSANVFLYIATLHLRHARASYRTLIPVHPNIIICHIEWKERRDCILEAFLYPLYSMIKLNLHDASSLNWLPTNLGYDAPTRCCTSYRY